MIYGITRDLSNIYFGEKPKHFTVFFESLITRAIRLINLDPEDVRILNDKRYDVEGMLLTLFPEILISEDNQNEDSNIELEDKEPISFAKKLYLNINTLELGPSDQFSWPQYFGLLALMEIDHHIIQNEWFLDSVTTPPSHIPDWEERLLNSKISVLLSASEAVNFGESLVEKNAPVNGLVKDKISKQNQQAVLKRHKPLRDLKNTFVMYFIKSEDRSNKSRLARKFYKSLPEAQQKIICQTQEVDKAVRTLLTHLNKAINNQNEPYTFL